MKKTFIKRIIALLLIAVLACGLCGCGLPSSKEKEVKSLIQKFENACQSANADEILDCWNPSITKPVRSVLKLLGKDDLDGCLEKVIDAISFIEVDGSNPSDVLKTYKIETQNFSFSDEDNTCSVAARISYQVGDKLKEADKLIICEKNDDGWHIMKIK